MNAAEASTAAISRNLPHGLAWLHELRRLMPQGEPTSSGNDWYKPVVATACIAATVAMLNMWADMRIIKGDVMEIKQVGIRNTDSIIELERRVTQLEVRVQTQRELLRMTNR